MGFEGNSSFEESSEVFGRVSTLSVTPVRFSLSDQQASFRKIRTQYTCDNLSSNHASPALFFMIPWKSLPTTGVCVCMCVCRLPPTPGSFQPHPLNNNWFWRNRKISWVIRRAKSFSAIRFWFSDFFSRFVLTTSCEIAFLSLENNKKHRDLNTEICFKFNFFVKISQFCRVKKNSTFEPLTASFRSKEVDFSSFFLGFSPLSPRNSVQITLFSFFKDAPNRVGFGRNFFCHPPLQQKANFGRFLKSIIGFFELFKLWSPKTSR
jgi:hypothetical protein